MVVEKFPIATIESIAKVLGDTEKGFSGTQITNLFAECDIEDTSGESTKWKRIHASLCNRQTQDRCANNIVNLMQHAMSPQRYINDSESFDHRRHELNKAISFEGLSVGEDGKVIALNSKATTLSEAEERASGLRDKLKKREVHKDVLICCKAEWLVNDYFHAVHEATKSVFQKIRDRTDLTSDGAALVDEAFAFKKQVPHLAINILATESEISEQLGFMNLLKGVFGTFRNPTSHELRIKWEMNEEDALDILSMVSLIHRRIDSAQNAKKIQEGKE